MSEPNLNSLLRPVIASHVRELKTASEEDLFQKLWPAVRDSGVLDGLGGGDHKKQVIGLIRRFFDETTDKTGIVGQEIRRYLSDEKTLDDIERLTLIVAFLFALFPELRDSSVPALLALIIFELRQRQKKYP